MSAGKPSGKRATIWLHDFYGNPIVMSLPRTERAFLMAVILQMNAMDSADITEEVVRLAAKNEHVDRSKIRKVLQKAGAIFDRRPDGTLFSSKTERRVGDRKYRNHELQTGQNSGQKSSQKLGQNRGLLAESVSAQNTNKSSEQESGSRSRVKEKEKEKASMREETYSGESIQERKSTPPASSKRGAPVEYEDPLAELVKRTAGRAGAADWTKGLAAYQLEPTAALARWDARNGDRTNLADTFERKSGLSLILPILARLTEA